MFQKKQKAEAENKYKTKAEKKAKNSLNSTLSAFSFVSVFALIFSSASA